MDSTILLIACQDRKGLIYLITKILFEHDVNIISNGEFVEKETNSFFMRSEIAGSLPAERILDELRGVLPAGAFIQLLKKRKKDIVILATRESHCVGDLLMRHHANLLQANVLAVVSNHDVLKDLVEKFGVRFHHIGHEDTSREQHESKLTAVLDEYKPEYLVLAKYMRILSPAFIARFPHRIVNIHHSFLPAFVGAKPYEKAYKRAPLLPAKLNLILHKKSQTAG